MSAVPDDLFPENLDAALAARAREFPERGPTRDRVEALCAELADRLAERLRDVPVPVPPAFGRPPVFLAGAMKSGTTLLADLLDGHPDLFVMPGDSQYFPSRRHLAELDFLGVLRWWTSRLVNPTGQPPHWFLPRDPEIWVRFAALLRALHDAREESFFAAARAACSARGFDPARLAPVEKTPENERHAIELARLHPGARFIQLVRHPSANLLAVRGIARTRGWGGGGYVALTARLARLLDLGVENLASLGPERYRIVRYEDLVADVPGTLRSIAEFLGIPFDPVLMRPTRAGAPATSNSMDPSHRVRGIVLDKSDPAPAAARLPWVVRLWLLLRLGTRAARFGYRLGLHPAANRVTVPSALAARGGVTSGEAPRSVSR